MLDVVSWMFVRWTFVLILRKVNRRGRFVGFLQLKVALAAACFKMLGGCR